MHSFSRSALGLLLLALAPILNAQPVVLPESQTPTISPAAPSLYRGLEWSEHIPYAYPPVGDRRWRPPEPITPEDARRISALVPETMCKQPPPAFRRDLQAVLDRPQKNNEDCLTLRVISGVSKTAKAPVMVWIHGEDLLRGDAYDDIYSGATLARDGVVFVSFNYRLGIFGFLAHPELTAESGTSGNYGLMDAIAALEWVQSNIDQWGGDPANVTIFSGQEGATLAAALIASPEAKGLFKRAILQSGSWMDTTIAPMQTLAEAEKIGERQLAQLGDLSLAQLRAAHAGDIWDLLPEPSLVVDGRYIPRDLASMFARGEQNAVDVLVGSNREEGIALLAGTRVRTAAEYESATRERLGELADDYLRIYPSGTDAEALTSYASALSDELAWQMRLLARSQAAVGRAAYVYGFSRVPPSWDREMPASSTRRAELEYVFRTYPANVQLPVVSYNRTRGSFTLPSAASSGTRMRRWTAGDYQLGDVMANYWIQFARAGEPSGAMFADTGVELPDWPAYAVSTESTEWGVMGFGDAIGMESSWTLTPEKLELFERMYAELVPEASR